eukprot:PITA_10773
MSIQRIWKRLIMDEVALVSTCVSIPMSLFRPLAINANPHIKVAKFCTETAIPSPTPPDAGVVTDFFINKCEEKVMESFKVADSLGFARGSKIFGHALRGFLGMGKEKIDRKLQLLSSLGFSEKQIYKLSRLTPAILGFSEEPWVHKIRKVVLMNPGIFLYKSKRDLKSRLSYLRSIINKEDMCKLVYNDSQILNLTEDKIKSAISVLQRLGIEGDALSNLLARAPRLLTYTEEKVMESFNVLEGLGFERGSKLFGHALRGLLGMGKEKIDRTLQLLSSLGFSEKQIYKLSRLTPGILGLSEEKLKRNVDFLVKSLGLPLDDIVRYPLLLTCNLERRIIPRYRVMRALKSMQLLKRERISPQIVNYTDKQFLEKYVNGNPEYSSVLRGIYYGEKAVKVDS